MILIAKKAVKSEICNMCENKLNAILKIGEK